MLNIMHKHKYVKYKAKYLHILDNKMVNKKSNKPIFKMVLKPCEFRYGCIHSRDCYIGSFYSIYNKMTYEQFRYISNAHPQGITDNKFKIILEKELNINNVSVSELELTSVLELYKYMYKNICNGEFTIIVISPIIGKNMTFKHVVVTTKYKDNLVLIDRQNNKITQKLKKNEYIGYKNIVLYLTTYLDLFVKKETNCYNSIYFQEFNKI